MSLWQQFREVFSQTARWIRREPWMLTILGPIWIFTHTPEERSEHIRRVFDE